MIFFTTKLGLRLLPVTHTKLASVFPSTLYTASFLFTAADDSLLIPYSVQRVCDEERHDEERRQRNAERNVESGLNSIIYRIPGMQFLETYSCMLKTREPLFRLIHRSNNYFKSFSNFTDYLPAVTNPSESL